LRIKIFYDDTKYRIRKVKEKKQLIIKVIRKEKKIPGDLNFIYTNDENIRIINKEFLKRDNFTDVIAFDYSVKKIVSGEIYISVDTVKINSNNYEVSLHREILRVMIHGTLHLCGYDDKNDRERSVMRELEDFWLYEYFGK